MNFFLILGTLLLFESVCASEESRQSSPPLPGTRVELHLHLDGSVRTSTIAELATSKGVNLTKHNTVEEITQLLRVNPSDPHTLGYFLSRISLYLPLFVGDLPNIERIAYELAEDEAQQKVAYFEARFAPHLLTNESTSVDSVVQAVARGLRRGRADFGVWSRMILCTIKGHPSWSEGVLNLAVKYRPLGVVGIDIAGNETEGYSPQEISIFEKASQLGVHRTVHAGESGPASNVQFAIERLLAERIGHGYAVVKNRTTYQMAITRGVHFEACPTSSLLTGAVADPRSHPMKHFAADGASFSISKDDSTVTQTTLDSEYKLVREKMKIGESIIRWSNLEAARKSFLSKKAKRRLVRLIAGMMEMEY